MADQKSDWVIVPDDFPGYSLNLFNIPTHYKKTIENGKFLVNLYMRTYVKVFIHETVGSSFWAWVFLDGSFKAGSLVGFLFRWSIEAGSPSQLLLTRSIKAGSLAGLFSDRSLGAGSLTGSD